MAPEIQVRTGPAPGGAGRLFSVSVAGRVFELVRSESLDSLWERMGSEEFGEDERIPYWAELWPANLALAEWVLENGDLFRGRVCLDLGCGLGLAGIAAADRGARVLGLDLFQEALVHARDNALRNGISGGSAPLWVRMDWRRPGLRPGSLDLALGGDVLYERRFFGPIARFLDWCLAPEGRAWLAEPCREVAGEAWDRLEAAGLLSRVVREREVPGPRTKVLVRIHEISRAVKKS